MKKTNEIGLRDPFVLLWQGKYYMYGTDNRTAWSGVSGFPCYVSDDLENWEGPVLAFERPEGFWADDNFWAPEVHAYQGGFYMLASFYSRQKTRATQILKADKPEGPFAVWSPEPVTPKDWMCLDGTLYIENQRPYVVFCHEWTQIGTGEICLQALTPDLRGTVGAPKTLFAADEAPWVTPHQQGLIAGKPCMITDGPFLYKDEEQLTMFWASCSQGNYAEGMAVSQSGSVLGPWKQLETPLFSKDGGHGMLFITKEGKTMFTLHRPNANPHERPVFFPLTKAEDGRWRIADE